MDIRILVVEDEPDIRKMLTDFLTGCGYITDQAADGYAASEKLRDPDYDIILMDLMLPGIPGEQLIRDLRTHSDIPVIVLSARSMLETRLEVLRLGADDYILKPFDLKEVQVRIEVVLRRSGKDDTEKTVSFRGLEYISSENRLIYKGESVNLTLKELQLIKLMMEYPKKTFTKANLYESVWEQEYICEDNTINVHMSNLRSKLKKACGEDFIETVWGIGYRLKGE
ncbi:MAG: response regulator transcription factor [Ruminococcus sp.]|nr:response regulator transcription factor [Ruminococcus sp.]